MFYFVCWTFIAAAQKKSYEISVYTADIEDAGSDANVSIIITGEKGTMPESVKLDNPKNNFEKGQYVFTTYH